MFTELLKTLNCHLTKLEMTFSWTRLFVSGQIVPYSFLGSTITNLMAVRFIQSQPVSFSSPVLIQLCFLTFCAVLTPTKTYRWFRKNSGWQEDWKQMPLDKLCRRWIREYKPTAKVKDPLPFNSRTVPGLLLNVCGYICLWSYKQTLSISHIKRLRIATMQRIPTMKTVKMS